MGDKNSSVTRVWPVFDFLLNDDPSGQKWLSTLLRLGSHYTASKHGVSNIGDLLPEVSSFERKLPRNMRKVLGEHRATKLNLLRNAFEKDFPPAPAFLCWMLQNPKCLRWPTFGNGKERIFGTGTQMLRKRFMDGDLKVSLEGQRELEMEGSSSSRRKWWAFEGWTSVDCWLETDAFILFIEGKRTEPVSMATAWFPERNQLVRNLEVAEELAAKKGKDFAVLLCAEEDKDDPSACFDKSLPHKSMAEREELRKHYLGCATWKDIHDELCPQIKLPEGLDDAVEFCAKFR